jgi:hypothetical protein
MVLRGEHDDQDVDRERQKKQRGIDDSQEENAESAQRRQEDYYGSDD